MRSRPATRDPCLFRCRQSVIKARLFCAVLAALGCFSHLWPALAAPVVLWSDSRLDLEWARTGIGIWKPIPPEGEKGLPLHLAKPGYLLFLRGAMAFAPALGEARSVVLAQSLLLWLSIAGTSFYLARRRGFAVGVSLYLALILFLRLRDASSAVMSESLSSSLLLPFVALLLSPSALRGARGSVVAGAASALLFWVRPNLGGIALALGVLVAPRSWRSLAALVGAFAGLVFIGWILTAPAAATGDSLRGLSHPLFAASASYYWLPSLGPWPEGTSEGERAREELRHTVENWKNLFLRWNSDARREFLWRALHGLFGTEFYDARWSPLYRRIDTISRTIAPFLLLASLALLLVSPFRESDRVWNVAAPLLLLLLLAQNLLLGSHPRYILPFLPVLLMLAVIALLSLRSAARRRQRAFILLFGGLTAFVATQSAVLDWEWGMIESSGVRLRQPIPRGALPREEPATLHLRIAPPVVGSDAHLEVFGPGSRRLYSSIEDISREKPAITIPLPMWLLEMNRQGPVELELVSLGGYGPVEHLLFPVVPRPWGAPARREGNAGLSPSTGIADGSLDWWAHSGAEPERF